MLTRRRLMDTAAATAVLSGVGVMRLFGQTAEGQDQSAFEITRSDEEFVKVVRK